MMLVVSPFHKLTEQNLFPQHWTGSDLGPGLDLTRAPLPWLGVSRQPAVLHRLCGPGVHLFGQEARLWRPAHHH